MAAKTSYFKVHKYRGKGKKPQWSWKLMGRNGEPVAWGSGLNRAPNEKYIHHLSALFAQAAKKLSK